FTSFSIIIIYRSSDIHIPYTTLFRSEAMQRIYELIIFEHSTTEDKARELFEVFEPLFANVRQSPEFYALLFTLPTVTALLPKMRSEVHTSELQSRFDLVCCLLLEQKK